MTMNWVGDDQVLRNMDAYGERAYEAARQIALYWAGVMETYAKENAAWEDRTGNARQALRGFIDEVTSDESIVIYLSQGMDYGWWLEIRWAGKYAIIWPTIEEHIPQIRAMLREVFS